MYYEFSKNDILLMQQLKVLVPSRIKTVLWNAQFSRILICGYFEPLLDTLSVFRPEHDFFLNLPQHTVDNRHGLHELTMYSNFGRLWFLIQWTYYQRCQKLLFVTRSSRLLKNPRPWPPKIKFRSWFLN